MISLHPVESSMLAAAGYDPATQTLVVLFNNGKAYEYYQVPPETYQGMLEAESIGKFMRANVIGVFDESPFRGWKKNE
ncbi:MAG: KTSC domain-containing protein [Chloroflexi bacterium]|jgi:hypothetical protein|nr:KTSC domain-containing protein [Chloroflexota bacterium]